MSDLPTPEDFDGWYVVQAHGRAEARVRDQLEDIGIEVYLPMSKHLVRHARRTEVVQRPLIPRHLFVFVKVKGDFYAVKTARHVVGLLGSADGTPRRVNDEQLAKLHLMEELGAFDETPAARPTFDRDQIVRVTEGELEGRLGSFAKLRGKDRAMVLLTALTKSGTRCLVNIDVAALEAA